jgi:hypothetical protein
MKPRKYHFAPTIGVVLAVSMCVLFSCSNDGEPKTNVVDFGGYTLAVPDGWKVEEQHGYDSYVTEIITSSNEVISTDFGRYSNSLDVDAGFHVFTLTTIDGRDAKIVRPITAGNGVTGVFFANVGNNNRFQMNGTNLSLNSQNLLLASIRTLNSSRVDHGDIFTVFQRLFILIVDRKQQERAYANHSKVECCDQYVLCVNPVLSDVSIDQDHC